MEEPDEPVHPQNSLASRLPDLVIDLIFQHLEAIVREEEEWSAWRAKTKNGDVNDAWNPNLNHPTSPALSPPALAQLQVYKELASMVRVCRNWSGPAQRRLYRRVAYIYSLSQYQDQLTRFLNTPPVDTPAIVSLDLTAADNAANPQLIVASFFARNDMDRGALREIHFPTYDGFSRYAPHGLENNEAAFRMQRFCSNYVNVFFDAQCVIYFTWSRFSPAERAAFEARYVPEAKRLRFDDMVQALSKLRPITALRARTKSENESLPMPLSNLRVLTLPVSWEWSHHLYRLVDDLTCDWISRWCPELREIRAMSGDVVSPEGLKTLVNGCRKLTMLRIWKAPQQTDDVLEEIGRCLPDLSEFALSFAPRVTAQGLAHLFALPKFAGVDLTCCRGAIFSRELFQVLERTGGRQKLERLDLSVDFWQLEELEQGGNVAGPASDSNVFLLEREITDIWTALGTWCVLMGRKRVDESLEGTSEPTIASTIVEPPGQTELTEIIHRDARQLHFGANPNPENSYLASLRIAHFFTGLSNLPNLTVLILSGHSALSDTRIKMLFPPDGPLAHNITKLGLGSCTALTDDGISHLARNGPKRMEQLELLRMSGKVTDLALRAIADAWGQSLEVLEISESRGFTEAGLVRLG